MLVLGHFYVPQIWLFNFFTKLMKQVDVLLLLNKHPCRYYIPCYKYLTFYNYGAIWKCFIFNVFCNSPIATFLLLWKCDLKQTTCKHCLLNCFMDLCFFTKTKPRFCSSFSFAYERDTYPFGLKGYAMYGSLKAHTVFWPLQHPDSPLERLYPYFLLPQSMCLRVKLTCL